MKFTKIIIILLLINIPAVAAKYAGEPFSLGVSARSLAMGGAAIAGPFDGSAAYWNPAGLNYLDGQIILAMHSETFGSLLNHDFLAYANSFSPQKSHIYGFGLYLYYLGGGGVNITDANEITGRYEVLREESHGDFLLAGAISTRVLNKIDLGMSVKIIYRDIVDVTGYGLSADIGLLYNLHKKVRLGMTITDIFSGIIRYSNGHSESIMPTVRPGILIMHEVKDFAGKLAISGDIKFEGIKNDAQFWLGEISLDTHYGLEIGWRKIIFGRAGFDIGNFTTGVGLKINKIIVDMAYLHNSVLDETYRLSASYNF